jgi:hypothetical protein
MPEVRRDRRLVNAHGEVVQIDQETCPENIPIDTEIFPTPRFATDDFEIAILKNFPKCAGTLDQLEKHWQLSNGLLFYNHRLFIPEQFRSDLLHDNHSTPAAGHPGFQKTIGRLTNLYYWPSMRADCYTFTKTCDRCQLSKKSTIPKRNILQPLDIPTESFASIHLDSFPVPLNSHKEDTVLIVVEKLSKILAHLQQVNLPYFN